ncbi:MAG: LysM peptidoglycan-binding domain-containing protein [Rhodoglobus sp.]
MSTVVINSSDIDASVVRVVGRTQRTSRLRLTRRGRFLLTAVAAAPVVIGAMFFPLDGGQATATRDGSDADFRYLTVASGETLWQLATELAPHADPREVIDQIIQLNQLASADVFAGQEIAIPAEYSQP